MAAARRRWQDVQPLRDARHYKFLDESGVIELAFAKLKAFLRAARPRTFDQVVELVAAAIGLFTPQECTNFVRHCRYRLSTVL